MIVKQKCKSFMSHVSSDFSILTYFKYNNLTLTVRQNKTTNFLFLTFSSYGMQLCIANCK